MKRLILIFALLLPIPSISLSADPQSYLRTVVTLDNHNFVIINQETKGLVYTLMNVDENGKLNLKDMAVVKYDAFGVASLEAAREIVNVRTKE